MYNGDSFGWLMDAPVTGGPYTFFNDPQYVGTTAAMLGSAVYYNSVNGYGAQSALWLLQDRECLTWDSVDRDHGRHLLDLRAVRGGPPHEQDLRSEEQVRPQQLGSIKISRSFVRFMA